MDNCHQCKKLISKYIENELDNNSQIQIKRHFKECPSCYSIANNIKALRNIFAKLPTISTSNDFDSILRARIIMEKKQEKRKRESLFFPMKVRVPIYGMSLALIAFIAIMIFSQISNHNTISQQAFINRELEDGRFAQLNDPQGDVLVYSLDRESATNVLYKSRSTQLEKQEEMVKTNEDSSAIAVYSGKSNNLSNNFYQTSF